MEVVLYNSTVCRLCGEENDNGTFLYSTEENSQNISDLVNAYLPIKVSDDGQLPRTICPGCTIQLEATVEFINLIVIGQRAIRALHQREKEYKKSLNKTITNNETTDSIVDEVDTASGVYQDSHPISLQVAGLDRPKRKRGRPPKRQKAPNELAQEAAAMEQEQEVKIKQRDEEPTGKRRRKTPERLRGVVQGKELEKIFKEEGMTDGEESEIDEPKPEVILPKNEPKVPEVIGHTESGELVVIMKGKGRGRPKGSSKQTRETCAICNKEFSNSGRYMSHIAQHGPVLYQCQPCGTSFPTRLDFNTHQQETSHEGLTVLKPLKNEDSAQPPAKAEESEAEGPPEAAALFHPEASLPDLSAEAQVEVNVTEELLNVPAADENDTELKDESKSECKHQDDDESPKKLKLKCPHCDKKYSSKQSKSLHIKAVHKGERPYICNECGASFAYPRALTLHSLAHRRRNTNKGFACDLCGKVLNHPSSVAYHKEAEHANQRYVCNKCGKHFKHKQLLQRHQLVHSSNRPFCCKVCNAKFKTKANLMNHHMLHTGVKRYSCEECKQRFAHKTSLTLHMRWHRGQKPYVCKICEKAFTQKGNLSEHMRIHTGEKPFQCALCPRRFTTSSQHRLHLRRHEPRANRQTQRISLPTTESTTSTIVNDDGSITHFTFTTAEDNTAVASTSEPVQSIAVASTASVHKCVYCNRVCPTRWALSKHLRLHTGEKPFRCPHCFRTFADASNLNKHKKQVHKQTSLLVTPTFEDPLSKCFPPAPAPDEYVVESAADDDERVIYVTYDVDAELPGIQIMDSEQEVELESPKELPSELYSGEALLKVEQPEHMSVTDEQGNPLHFTMQDGTRLAITSLDGHSLQVITQDGQTIPVEINGLAPVAEEESPMHITIEEDMKDEEPSSPVTHYYTIV